MECQFLSHWYDSTPKKSRRKRDSNPGSSALEADAFPLGQRGGLTVYGALQVNNNNNNNNNCIQRRSSRVFTISLLRGKLSPTRTLKWPRHNRVKITYNTLSAYHVQRVVCHLVRRDSSAIKFDRVEISFILALLYWLKPLTDEGGKETRVPGENP